MARAPSSLLRLAGRALAQRSAAAAPSSALLASQAAAAAGAPPPRAAAAALLRLRHAWLPSPALQQRACYADDAAGKGKAEAEAAAGASGDESGASDAEPPSVEHLTAELREREKAVEELQAKVNDLADSFKRSLAEMENLRQRTSRQVENAQKFAVEPIIKSLLDVADNLQRAADAVPGSVLDGSEEIDPERTLKLLRSLLEGVRMTEGVLIKVFQRHGVEQYNPAGEKFDPNLHSAMFEVPDATKEAGVIAMVSKRGYKMHDRILRAAEVGVYKQP
ncbi:grpE mitochondrial-like [Raphidocelis subcapitata]|uniref:GrpE protein homolog n=1 Tax=Raphidocelis subcapitata TaxID=307507 RepID=A0A2V0NM49_9CHLO|nr:grpE mitochondrial-like [Raphidocelis subcapitata]|eukprot:GBF88541.1 grpE mitochondrial-like [Raphidocelis subcapitata]